MNQPEEFGITREGIQAILRKTFTKLFPVMLIAALAGITIPMIQEMESSKKENFDLFDLIPFFIVGGFMTISIFRTKKRLENIYRGRGIISFFPPRWDTVFPDIRIGRMIVSLRVSITHYN